MHACSCSPVSPPLTVPGPPAYGMVPPTVDDSMTIIKMVFTSKLMGQPTQDNSSLELLAQVILDLSSIN